MHVNTIEYNIRRLERGLGVAQREEARKPEHCEKDYQSIINDYSKQLESIRDELEILTGNRDPSTPRWPL